MMGSIERSARTARLTIGGTLRGGVAWIPTLSLGIGGQARWQTAAVFVDTGQHPDGYGDAVVADVVATARVGFEHRLGRRWIVGASVAATHAIPLGGPAFDVIEGTLGATCAWYPLF